MWDHEVCAPLYVGSSDSRSTYFARAGLSKRTRQYIGYDSKHYGSIDMPLLVPRLKSVFFSVVSLHQKLGFVSRKQLNPGAVAVFVPKYTCFAIRPLPPARLFVFTRACSSHAR